MRNYTNFNLESLAELSNKLKLEKEEKLKALKELRTFQKAIKLVEKGSETFYEIRNDIIMSDYVINYIFNASLKTAYNINCDIMELFQYVATSLLDDIDNFDFKNGKVLLTTYLFKAIKGHVKDYPYRFMGDISYNKYASFYIPRKYISKTRTKTPLEEESTSGGVSYQQDKDTCYADKKTDVFKNVFFKRTIEKLLEKYTPVEKNIIVGSFLEGAAPAILAEKYHKPVEKVYELIKKFKSQAQKSQDLNEFRMYYGY